MKQILKLHEQEDTQKKINCAEDIFNNIKEIDIDYDQEHLLVFFLNVRKKLLKCEVLFKGGVTECIMDPKIIFRKALLNKAVAIIVAHNHPSNELCPSGADIQSTKDLVEAGKLLQIEVLDSVIFNPKEYWSMSENALM